MVVVVEQVLVELQLLEVLAVVHQQMVDLLEQATKVQLAEQQDMDLLEEVLQVLLQAVEVAQGPLVNLDKELKEAMAEMD